MEPQDSSGLKCLQLLFGQVRHTVNFPALITQKVMQRYQTDPVRELADLARDQQLRPEIISSPDIFRTYRGAGQDQADGMEAQCEIRCGRRRVIEYVLYPLIKALDETAREP